MDNKKVIKIVIAKDDYTEAYAHLPNDPKELKDKVKRGMLERLGYSTEQINLIIDQLDIDYDAGIDGMFDDGPYTPIRLVRNIFEEPGPGPIPIPDPEPEPDPIPDPEPKPDDPEPEPGTKDNQSKKPRQVMLQQYYGDRKAEQSRNEAFLRYKSHITTKHIKVVDKDGKERSISVYTVEDYDGKEQDVDNLLLEGFETRLERLSRAHQKDFSPYERMYSQMLDSALKEVTERYKEMHEVDPEKADEFKEDAIKQFEFFRSDEFKKKAIQALIDQDTEFIETNNYGYNSHQNTNANLKTLGKYGEKSVKAQVSVDQPKMQKIGLHTMNVLIDIRNHTTAPVNRAIGEVASFTHRMLYGIKKPKSKEPVDVDGFLITPMEDMIETSQKNTTGMFKNKPIHRYEARKNYFAQQIDEEEQAKSEEKIGPDGKPPVKKVTLGLLIKKAIVPRVKSVVNFKEGNIAVLNAGLYDLETAAEARQQQIQSKKAQISEINKRIEARKKEIGELTTLMLTIRDPEKREQIAKAIELRETEKLALNAQAAEISRTEIDSIQTDALSMSQHDKANKETIHCTVAGVKLAAKIATAKLVAPYLYRTIVNKTTTPSKTITTPGEIITEESLIPIKKDIKVPGLDQEGIEAINLGDIYSNLPNKTLYEYTIGGGNAVNIPADHFRGLRFEYNGQMFSGHDGIGFDLSGIAGVQIDPIDGNTSLVGLIKDIIFKRTGQDIPIDQVSKMVGKEINGICLGNSWKGSGKNGGWTEDITGLLNNMIAEGEHTETIETFRKVVKTINIPGTTVTIPGSTIISTTRELNPAVVAAYSGLAALALDDANNLARFTRSQESNERRQPKTLRAMAEENNRRRAEEGKKEKADSTKPPKKKRDIKSYQRNNKSKARRYTYSGSFEFSGTKGKDFNSGYDENLIGANDHVEFEGLEDDVERD